MSRDRPHLPTQMDLTFYLVGGIIITEMRNVELQPLEDIRHGVYMPK
jgi:hypothetical protein